MFIVYQVKVDLMVNVIVCKYLSYDTT